MGSLAGRVSATAGAFFQVYSKQAVVDLNQKSETAHLPAAVSLLKPAFATPPLTWTLQTQINFRHLIAAGLQSPPSSLWRIGLSDEEEYSANSHNFVHSVRFRRRRSFRDSETPLTAARGDDATDETAAIQHSKVREAPVFTWSLIFKWNFLSLITTLVLSGLHWVDATCTRGQECTKPRFERLRKRSESLRYWAYVSCLLFCWLSVAFFLHWQVQRWELRTMVPADPQGVADGAFDPGGSFCHSMWPNTGLGCQISFTAM